MAERAVSAPPNNLLSAAPAASELRNRPFEDPVRRVGKFQPLDIGPGTGLQHRTQIDVFGDQRVGRGERGELEVEILRARRQGGEEQSREVDVVTDGGACGLVDSRAAPFQDQRKEQRVAGEAAQIATAGRMRN